MRWSFRAFCLYTLYILDHTKLYIDIPSTLLGCVLGTGIVWTSDTTAAGRKANADAPRHSNLVSIHFRPSQLNRSLFFFSSPSRLQTLYYIYYYFQYTLNSYFFTHLLLNSQLFQNKIFFTWKIFFLNYNK